MDADGLPIVGDGIDFTKVGAIHQKRTLAFLNHFISHTVRFLNRFSGVCEEKLEDLTGRLQRIETTMNILEAKLSSIAGLENVTVASSSSTSQPAAASSDPASSSQPAASPAAPAAPASADPAPEQPPPPPEPVGMTVSQDPRFKKYFTMLNMGVHIMAIQQKMRTEGVDPELINNPNAPAPAAIPEDDDDDDDDVGIEHSDDSETGFESDD